MANASVELQSAIYNALISSPVLPGLLGGPDVFDMPPDNAEFPYVTIGQNSIFDWSTSDDDGSEHLVSLHVWSRGRGKSQSYEIMAAVDNELGNLNGALGEHRLVALFREISEVGYDHDMQLHHGILRYRALIETADSVN